MTLGGPVVRGNPLALFLIFFGLTTALAGAMYGAYRWYAETAGLQYVVLAGLSAIGFMLSLLVVARILYKAAA